MSFARKCIINGRYCYYFLYQHSVISLEGTTVSYSGSKKSDACLQFTNKLKKSKQTEENQMNSLISIKAPNLML